MTKIPLTNWGVRKSNEAAPTPDQLQNGFVNHEMPRTNVLNYLLRQLTDAVNKISGMRTGDYVPSKAYLGGETAYYDKQYYVALEGVIGENPDHSKKWRRLGISPAAGGGTDKLFYVSGVQVTADYAVPSGKNAAVVGPIEIKDNVTITIPDGSSLVIV